MPEVLTGGVSQTTQENNGSHLLGGNEINNGRTEQPPTVETDSQIDPQIENERLNRQLVNLDSKLTSLKIRLGNLAIDRPDLASQIAAIGQTSQGYSNEIINTLNFDISRAEPDQLRQYNQQLEQTIRQIDNFLAQADENLLSADRREQESGQTVERRSGPEFRPNESTASQREISNAAVISTLNSEAGLREQAELERRARAIERRLEIEPVNQAQIQEVERQVAAGIRAGWSADQRRLRLNWTDQEVITDALANEEDLDSLFRSSILRQRLDDLTAEARASLDKSLERMKDGGNGGRWRRIATALGGSALSAGGSALGIVGGTIVRHLGQQGLIALGVQSSHLVGLGGGLLAGAVVGGVSGFARGYYRGRREAYSGDKVIAEIESMRSAGRLNDEQAKAIYEQMLADDRVLGHEQAAYEKINEICRLRAERELQEALDGLAPIPGETEAQQRQRLALALTELNRRRKSPTGSELMKTNEVMEFLTEQRKRVRGEAFGVARREALNGALRWSAFGAVFGFFFNGPAIESQIHAQNVADQPLHQGLLTNLKEIAHQYGGNITGSEAAKEAVEKLVTNGDFNFKDMVSCLMSGNEYAAKQIAFQNGLDLGYHIPGTNLTLLEAIKNVAQATSDANGKLTENGLRAIFHLTSHPDAVGEHLGQFANIVTENFDKVNGHDFTARVLHGGTPWWQPFTGGAMQGGEYSDAMSQSARDYLTSHPDAPKNIATGLRHFWPLGTETPWFPFAFWVLSSAEAKWVNEKGQAGLEKLKGLIDKERIKSDERKYLSDTGKEVFDKNIFSAASEADPTKKSELDTQLANFKKHITGRHGQFFFVNNGKEIKAYRLWPYNNNRARQGRKYNINNPADLNRVGETGDPDYTLLQGGTIQVKEYTLDELSDTPIDAKYMRDNWDLPQWGTTRKAPIKLDYRDLFVGAEDGNMQQLFVAAKDVNRYARAARDGNLDRVGLSAEKLKTLRVLEEEAARRAAEGTGGTADASTVESTESGGESTSATPESATTSEIERPTPFERENQIVPGLVIEKLNANDSLLLRLTRQRPDGNWQYEYKSRLDKEAEFVSAGQSTISSEIILSDYGIAKIQEPAVAATAPEAATPPSEPATTASPTETAPATSPTIEASPASPSETTAEATVEHGPSGEYRLDFADMTTIKEFAARPNPETKESYLASIERANEILERESGLVELKNKDIPTVIVSDLHARREMLVNTLESKIDTAEGQRSVIDLLKEGKVNLVCVGDGLHTETLSNWSPRALLNKPGYEEFTRLAKEYDEALRASGGNESDPKVVEKAATLDPLWKQVQRELLNTEAARAFGLMKMAMELKASYPDNFHFIRGNHDDIQANVSKGGIDQGELFREWAKDNLGADFVEQYHRFETNLPSMILGNNLVISHAAPGKTLTRQQIEDRHPHAINVLGWTDNRPESLNKPKKIEKFERAVRETLANVGMPDARLFIGHRQVEPGKLYREQLGGKLIQMNDDRDQIIAVVAADGSFNPENDVKKIN